MNKSLGRSVELRCLVLTLYAGENEYAACKQSVSEQEGVVVEHQCFEYLGSVEAHEALYRTIVERKDEFDVFLKLDADMVFYTKNSLQHMVNRFTAESNLDHMQLPVFDLPSGTFLMGFHMFSSRVSWTFPLDPLFPDQQPSYPGCRFFDVACKERYIDHMTDPSDAQCYYLGLHRGSKVAQRGRQRNYNSASFQLSYLRRIAVNTRFDPARKALILRGMFRAILSQHALSQKHSIDDAKSFSVLEKALASGFSTPGLGQIIFRILRVRYAKRKGFTKRVLRGRSA